MTTRSVLLLVTAAEGFKAVNDRISHDVGDKALAEYGRLLPDVIYKCLGESGVVSTMEKPIVFRTGGDELAVVCVKSPTASFPDFEAQIATMVRTVAETVLFDAKRDGAAPESEWVPTFLRIGVASTFKLADEAETAVRTDIYRKGAQLFGTLGSPHAPLVLTQRVACACVFITLFAPCVVQRLGLSTHAE